MAEASLLVPARVEGHGRFLLVELAEHMVVDDTIAVLKTFGFQSIAHISSAADLPSSLKGLPKPEIKNSNSNQVTLNEMLPSTSVNRSSSDQQKPTSSRTPSTKRYLNCKKCNYSIHNEHKKLQLHIKTHASRKQFKCPSCSFDAHDAVEVLSHVHSYHQNGRLSSRYDDTIDTFLRMEWDRLLTECFPEKFEKLLPAGVDGTMTPTSTTKICTKCNLFVEESVLIDHLIVKHNFGNVTS